MGLSSTLALAIGASAIVAAGTAMAKNFGEWSAPVSAEIGSHPTLNTSFNDGCPIISPDGLSLYMATNRGNGSDIDIWVARRSSTTDGWGAPEALPAPINGPTQDFCPTPVRGKGLFFVSKRVVDGGGDPDGDIYFTKQRKDGSWEDPVRLGPNINSPDEEWSPSYYEDEEGRPVLYFSRSNPGNATHDIYVSVNWGPAVPAPGANEPGKNDARPNVRKDGLEMVWDSNRQNNGNQDIWTATRASTSHEWGPADHLSAISSPNGNDTRASLSWDGSLMVVGTIRPGVTEGQGDIYVSARTQVTGADD